MYLLYVDESGSPQDPNQQYFVLAGIAVFLGILGSRAGMVMLSTSSLLMVSITSAMHYTGSHIDLLDWQS
jgi:CheY-specific phosphatase CheX